MPSPSDPADKREEAILRPTPMGVVSRVLALDVGDRRIGLALSDSLGYTAQPLFTLHRSSLHSDLKFLARVVRRHSVSVIVIGLPLHASGDESSQAAKARRFAEALQAQHPAVALHLVDERHTTADAHVLLDRSRPRSRSKSSRQKRTEIVDQVAAVLLLEAFLSVSTPTPLLVPQS